MAITVRQSRSFQKTPVFGGFLIDKCTIDGPSGRADYVGFFNGEWGEQACGAITFQRAFDFNTARFDAIANKRIDNVMLVLAEAPAPYCSFIKDQVQRHCWQSGDGRFENKPNGCVLVRVPSIDWRTDGRTFGELPTLPRGPTIERFAPGRYNVTAAFRAQHGGGAPLGQAPGFGLLLVGRIDHGRLTGQDNTNCVSTVQKVGLIVQYTVLPPSTAPLPR